MACRCVFKHSGAPSQGENLYEAFYYPNTAHPLVNGWLSAVDAWYKEIAVYNYTKPGFTSAAGHFSAVRTIACTLLMCVCAKQLLCMPLCGHVLLAQRARGTSSTMQTSHERQQW